jgi:hypothetical protein
MRIEKPKAETPSHIRTRIPDQLDDEKLFSVSLRAKRSNPIHNQK